MGTFAYPITVSDLQGRHSVGLETTVDTGATYRILPRFILDRLGIEPIEVQVFRLADGRRVQLPIAKVLLRLNGRQRTVLCVFAPEDTTPLLSAFPLEAFSLATDPVNKGLVPSWSGPSWTQLAPLGWPSWHSVSWGSAPFR